MDIKKSLLYLLRRLTERRTKISFANSLNHQAWKQFQAEVEVIARSPIPDSPVEAPLDVLRIKIVGLNGSKPAKDFLDFSVPRGTFNFTLFLFGDPEEIESYCLFDSRTREFCKRIGIVC